jgi:hypothetical protein
LAGASKISRALARLLVRINALIRNPQTTDFFKRYLNNYYHCLPLKPMTMEKVEITIWRYLIKSVKWCLGNTIFGLAPLILLYIVFAMSHSSVFEDKINELISDGVILFVCCAITGAIVVEYWVSDFFILQIK